MAIAGLTAEVRSRLGELRDDPLAREVRRGLRRRLTGPPAGSGPAR
ncbi:hypothetical protein [Kitasatospora sp. NPDC057015]